jgi:hypothetical protein
MRSPRAVESVDHQQRVPADVVDPPAVRRQRATLTRQVLCLSLSFNLLVLGSAWWRRVAMTWYGHRLIIFGFLPQISKTKAVAVGVSVQQSRGLGEQTRSARIDDLAAFAVLSMTA